VNQAEQPVPFRPTPDYRLSLDRETQTEDPLLFALARFATGQTAPSPGLFPIMLPTLDFLDFDPTPATNQSSATPLSYFNNNATCKHLCASCELLVASQSISAHMQVSATTDRDGVNGRMTPIEEGL
jgi:hypothetical protein